VRRHHVIVVRKYSRANILLSVEEVTRVMSTDLVFTRSRFTRTLPVYIGVFSIDKRMQQYFHVVVIVRASYRILSIRTLVLITLSGIYIYIYIRFNIARETRRRKT